MQVQAEISVYPLRTDTMSEGILAFKQILESSGLETRMNSMSTFVTGEPRRLFDACGQAFEKVASEYQLALVMKVSSACPPPE